MKDMIQELLTHLAINSLKGNISANVGRLEIEQTPANGYWLRYISYDGNTWQSYTHPSRVSQSRVEYDYEKLLKAAYHIDENPSQVRML